MLNEFVCVIPMTSLLVLSNDKQFPASPNNNSLFTHDKSVKNTKNIMCDNDMMMAAERCCLLKKCFLVRSYWNKYKTTRKKNSEGKTYDSNSFKDSIISSNIFCVHSKKKVTVKHGNDSEYSKNHNNFAESWTIRESSFVHMQNLSISYKFFYKPEQL